MFFVVDSDREVSPQHTEFLWQRLWEMRQITPVGAMLPAGVISACPLLPDEPADSVLLATLVQVPGDTAWVRFELSLTDYANECGELDIARLDDELRTCVTQGDAAHDHEAWHNYRQSQDSLANRRLSVFVRGWGDLALRRGSDPGSIAVLAELSELAAGIANTLVDASRCLAQQRGYCPAIDVAGARVLRHGQEMNARWRNAIRDNAVRHRNLLTLSPWDVFPQHCGADARYMNLLPLLRRAHSISMHRDIDISSWNMRTFREFHERIAALLRKNSNDTIVVRQV
jgi:hypothetical protein